MTDPDPTPAAPPKKPGLFRPAALWLLPLTVLVLLALVPLAVEPWLAGKVRSAAALAGLELAPETRIAVSVFGGRITIDQLDLREVVDGQPRSLFKADRAELDADLLACLGGDMVLDTLVLEGASGDLRRRGDGTIPLATPPPEERGGTDWGKLDWWSHARKVYEWQKGEDEKAEHAESAPAEQKAPRTKPAHDWTGARSYEPAPGPRGPAMRVLIRKLLVSGRELQLPDDTPFAVTAFSVKGANLGWGRRERGTGRELFLQAHTRAAGRHEFYVGPGQVRLTATQLPLAALAHPALAGEAIARHGASGTADLTLAAQWSQQLGGTIQATVSGLKLEPKEPTPRQAQIAQLINRLGGKPLAWTMTLGGTPERPEIADDGLEALAKGSLADAARQTVIEEGTKKLEEQLQKNEKLQELQQNEDVKKATGKAKDLLKSWGK